MTETHDSLTKTTKLQNNRPTVHDIWNSVPAASLHFQFVVTLNEFIRKFHQFCNYESTIFFYEIECCKYIDSA